MAKAAGEPIPLGWAVDAGGSPTTDPEAALNGALISTGGYKGWALGLLVECLAAGLTGSVTSKNINGLKLADGPPHDLGQFYIAIDTSVSEGAFEARIAQVIEAIEQDPNIRLPGSPRKTLDRVEVDDALWAKLDALGSNS